MTISHAPRFAAALIAVAATFAGVSAAEAEAKPRKPSEKVVKRVIRENWDTDGTGPNRTKITFKKIEIRPMRARRVGEYAPSDWVSPVKAVFIWTYTYDDGLRDVAKMTQHAHFYKETRWWYHSKGATTKWLERR